jgi:hypothetical protein
VLSLRQTSYSLSSAIGYQTFMSLAAWRTLSMFCSNGNSGVWTPTTTKPRSLYFSAQAEGRIRQHQFGEGGYDDCERGIQQMLREAGAEGIADDLVALTPDGFEAQADWTNLRSPETYLGYEQGQNFASRGGAEIGVANTYVARRC